MIDGLFLEKTLQGAGGPQYIFRFDISTTRDQTDPFSAAKPFELWRRNQSHLLIQHGAISPQPTSYLCFLLLEHEAADSPSSPYLSCSLYLFNGKSIHRTTSDLAASYRCLAKDLTATI